MLAEQCIRGGARRQNGFLSRECFSACSRSVNVRIDAELAEICAAHQNSRQFLTMDASCPAKLRIERIDEFFKVLDQKITQPSPLILNGFESEEASLQALGSHLRVIWRQQGSETLYGNLDPLIHRSLGILRNDSNQFYLAYRRYSHLLSSASPVEQLQSLASYAAGIAMHIRRGGNHDNKLSVGYEGELSDLKIPVVKIRENLIANLDQAFLQLSLRKLIPTFIQTKESLKQKKIILPSEEHHDVTNTFEYTEYDEVMSALVQAIDPTLHLPQAVFLDEHSGLKEAKDFDYFSFHRWQIFNGYEDRSLWNDDASAGHLDVAALSALNRYAMNEYVSSLFKDLHYPDGTAVKLNELKLFFDELIEWKNSHSVDGISDHWSEAGYMHEVHQFSRRSLSDRTLQPWMRMQSDLAAGSLKLKFIVFKECRNVDKKLKERRTEEMSSDVDLKCMTISPAEWRRLIKYASGNQVDFPYSLEWLQSEVVNNLFS